MTPNARRELIEASAIAAATALVVVWVWGGSLQPLPVVHDEWAYVLQCEIFATGRWTAYSPPLPQFFEQFWVFVEPVVASKYWPGHSLLMTPGCAIGLPALIPVALSALTGALMFVLCRQFAGIGVALLAWGLWLTSQPNLHFRPTYFANVTTSAMWLVALWAMVRWRHSHNTGHLSLAFAAVAWAAIARPLTAAALGWPIIVLAIWWGRRRWRATAGALAVAVAILAILPYWSWKTIGTVTTTPYSLYARTYFPFDRPGFTFNATEPLRARPPEMERYGRGLGAFFRAHRPDQIPRVAYQRLTELTRQLFGRWRVVLLPFALGGIVVMFWRWPYAWVPLAGGSSLFLAHLAFAHPAEWTHYYFEAFPLVFVTVALGAAAFLSWLRCPRGLQLFMAGIVIVLCAGDLWRSRAMEAAWRHRVTAATTLIKGVEKPAIVFVRPEPWVSAFGLVSNAVDVVREPVWVVRDLGDENQRLANLAPERRRFLLELETMAIHPLP